METSNHTYQWFFQIFLKLKDFSTMEEYDSVENDTKVVAAMNARSINLSSPFNDETFSRHCVATRKKFGNV